MAKEKMTDEQFKEAMSKKWEMLEQVMNDDKMTATAIAVYAVIWKYYNIMTGYSHPSRSEICRLSHITTPTLDRALKLLIETGHIKIVSGTKGKTSKYYLLDKPVVKEEDMFDEAPDDYWMV